MAQKSISRLEGFDFTSQDPVSAAAAARADVPSDSLPSQSQIARPGAPLSTADLALDLVLHEMLQQARLTSSATGAAIVIVGESGIRCRATAGATAAEVAAHLQTRSKLLDACLRNRAVQRCDDTEVDTRFDPAACRRLGLRSVLICPVQDHDDKPTGAIELFSSRPGAFGDRDVLMLQAIAQRVVDNLGLIRKLAVPELEAPVVPQAIAEESIAPEISESPEPAAIRTNSTFELRTSVQKAFHIDSKLFLLVAAITLSIILGWMLGRTQGLRAKVRPKPRPAPVAQQVQPQQAPAAESGTMPSTVETSVPAVQLPDSVPDAVVEISRTPKAKVHAALEPSETQAPDETSVPAQAPSDSVVVFEDENNDSPQVQSLSSSQDNSKQRRSVAETSGAATSKGVVRLPADQAAANLLLRVEPDYPQKAREQEIQGAVVLDIAVGKDGKVQGISTISGDPQLALAAAHAVQQWRFKPWNRKGQPTPFESRITLNFSLP